MSFDDFSISSFHIFASLNISLAIYEDLSPYFSSPPRLPTLSGSLADMARVFEGIDIIAFTYVRIRFASQPPADYEKITDAIAARQPAPGWLSLDAITPFRQRRQRHAG